MIRGKDKVITICLFIISIGISMGQSYYGKHGLGKLNFINDTTAVADFFYASNGVKCADTCKVYSNGDTLFLTTQTTWLYKVYLYTEPIEKQNILWLESAFKYGKSLSDYYQWSNGTPLAGWYDSVSEMHYIECLTPFYKNAVNIIVLSQFGKYSRVAFYTKSTDYFYTIGLKQNPLYWEGWTGIVLDRFPLLVKGNRLVPCNDLKQVHCWIDNGLFFPIMKKNKHRRPFDYKATIYRGLQDLPFGVLPVKRSIPKKYFDYFYNEDNMKYFPAIIEENTQKDTVRK